MTPERWQRVGEIFTSAAEMESDERSAYLKKACGDDTTLLSEVESLLNAGDNAGRFISQPIVGKFVPEFADHMNALAPGSSIGHYTIEKAIGSGGMGEVYLATDTKLGRRIALKTLPPSFASDPSFLRRFRNEAQAAANINHPNVATVYSVEECNGIQFLTMEYIDGKTLDRLTPEDGIEVKTFLGWLEPIADALAAAHKRGIIHRDIKPGNIMISSDGTPKILDFGLAQIERSLAGNTSLARDITAPGQIIGTPSYMSPEQAEGANVDVRSDIFSFGTVMYEALTGKRPFRGSSQGLIVKAVIHSDPEPVAKHRPDVPYVVAKMVERCLQKSPGKRFQSMAEIRSILKEARTASDAGVSMDSFARRFYREATPPSRIWLLGAAAIVLVLALAGWYFISRPESISPYSIERMSIRKLSQTNNVALAAIAPDGKSVAYVTYEENGDRGLWLRRVSDANAIQIVPPQQVFYWDTPVFSNDGEYIYYVIALRGATHGTMYRVPALGGQPRKIVEKVNHLGNLSPDGQRILFVRYGEPDPNLSVNAADARLISADAMDGTDEREHQRTEGETIIRDPRFSPDGQKIYYSRRELDSGVEYWSVVVLSLRDGIETVLRRQKERIGELAVLPKENGLLMNSVDPDSNRRQLFYVSLLNGEVTRITNDISAYMNVSVDREGKNIVAAQRIDESRLWVGDSNSIGSMTAVTRKPFGHQNVDWTPDGRLVFDVYENSRLSVWISDPDGRNAVQLTPADSDNSEPRVSGDGKYIVFTSHRSGYNQIWRMKIDGSDPTLLADVPGIAQIPRFAADGKTVVFRWYNENSPPLGMIPIEGGKVVGIEGLPRATIYHWAMSPDASKVAYSFNDEGKGGMKVMVKGTGPGASETVLDIWPTRIFKWMPDGRSLLYQERQRGENLPTKLYQIEIDRPEPHLFLATEPDEIFDFSFSRDGRRIAAVRVKTITDAVMLTSIADGSRPN
ncbi:MAG: protein kinase [Pyrinomonadaceae bacterium]